MNNCTQGTSIVASNAYTREQAMNPNTPLRDPFGLRVHDRDSKLNGSTATDPVGDTLHGEGGNDRIHVRDGEVDKVDCGDGVDRVIADSFDQIAADCEKVTRAAPRPGREDASENATQSPSQDSAQG